MFRECNSLANMKVFACMRVICTYAYDKCKC